jgi:hypothetical protein
MAVTCLAPHLLPDARFLHVAAAAPATLQVFDVASFDMIAMLRLPFVPGCVEWCFQVGNVLSCLLV